MGISHLTHTREPKLECDKEDISTTSPNFSFNAYSYQPQDIEKIETALIHTRIYSLKDLTFDREFHTPITMTWFFTGIKITYQKTYSLHESKGS